MYRGIAANTCKTLLRALRVGALVVALFHLIVPFPNTFAHNEPMPDQCWDMFLELGGKARSGWITERQYHQVTDRIAASGLMGPEPRFLYAEPYVCQHCGIIGPAYEADGTVLRCNGTGCGAGLEPGQQTIRVYDYDTGEALIPVAGIQAKASQTAGYREMPRTCRSCSSVYSQERLRANATCPSCGDHVSEMVDTALRQETSLVLRFDESFPEGYEIMTVKEWEERKAADRKRRGVVGRVSDARVGDVAAYIDPRNVRHIPQKVKGLTPRQKRNGAIIGAVLLAGGAYALWANLVDHGPQLEDVDELDGEVTGMAWHRQFLVVRKNHKTGQVEDYQRLDLLSGDDHNVKDWNTDQVPREIYEDSWNYRLVPEQAYILYIKVNGEEVPVEVNVKQFEQFRKGQKVTLAKDESGEFVEVLRKKQ